MRAACTVLLHGVPLQRGAARRCCRVHTRRLRWMTRSARCCNGLRYRSCNGSVTYGRLRFRRTRVPCERLDICAYRQDLRCDVPGRQRCSATCYIAVQPAIMPLQQCSTCWEARDTIGKRATCIMQQAESRCTCNATYTGTTGEVNAQHAYTQLVSRFPGMPRPGAWLHRCSIASLHDCIVASLQYYTAASLHRCIIASLRRRSSGTSRRA